MRVFLSYASVDRDVVEAVAVALRSDGHDVFFDHDELRAGADFDREIRRNIDHSDVFVFFVSEPSLAHGGYARTELRLAREKWPAAKGHVVPVLLHPVAEIPADLRATLLEPEGNLVAEVAYVVDGIARARRRRRAAVIGGAAVLLAGATAVGVQLLPERPPEAPANPTAIAESARAPSQAFFLQEARRLGYSGAEVLEWWVAGSPTSRSFRVRELLAKLPALPDAGELLLGAWQPPEWQPAAWAVRARYGKLGWGSPVKLEASGLEPNELSFRQSNSGVSLVTLPALYGVYTGAVPADVGGWFCRAAGVRLPPLSSLPPDAPGIDLAPADPCPPLRIAPNTPSGAPTEQLRRLLDLPVGAEAAADELTLAVERESDRDAQATVAVALLWVTRPRSGGSSNNSSSSGSAGGASAPPPPGPPTVTHGHASSSHASSSSSGAGSGGGATGAGGGPVVVPGCTDHCRAVYRACFNKCPSDPLLKVASFKESKCWNNCLARCDSCFADCGAKIGSCATK